MSYVLWDEVRGRGSFAYVISLGILTTMATFDMTMSYDRNDYDRRATTHSLRVNVLTLALSPSPSLFSSLSLIFTPRAGGLNFTH